METSNTEKYHSLAKVTVADDILSFDLGGQHYSFSLIQVSQILANATRVEREIFRVSPSGYGIHWPLVDEDLSIDGLLGISHQPRKKSEDLHIAQSFQ